MEYTPEDIKYDIGTTLLSKGVKCPKDVGQSTIIEDWIISVPEEEVREVLQLMIVNPDCPVKLQGARICHTSREQLKEYNQRVLHETSWFTN